MRDAERFANTIFILCIIYIIVLKFTGMITISWFWILSPIWILFGLGIIITLVIISIISIKILKEKKNERN